MRNFRFFLFSLLLFAVLHCVTCIKLTDVTVDLFHSETDGVVAAFGDFNADKFTDIFVVDDSGKLFVMMSWGLNKITSDVKYDINLVYNYV